MEPLIKSQVKIIIVIVIIVLIIVVAVVAMVSVVACCFFVVVCTPSIGHLCPVYLTTLSLIPS